ncbi:heparin lyase I family protein [Azospirillum oleiclasticum]|nr:heparin lyase I family protein [Azospirillum oleiclasticum]
MATTRPGLLFEQTFDSGSDVTALGFKYSGNKDVTLGTVAGQRAAKISLDHYKSDYAYRTEIQPTKLPASHFDSGMFAKMNQEYWYGMRVYLDEGWKETDKADTVLMQFHSQPDAGEAWRNPPVALQVVNKNGEQHLNLIVRSDSSKITTGSGEGRYDSSKQYDLGKIDGDIGKWTDLVWHVKWNHDGSGYLQLYKDGKIIADLKGANAFNDATGPYLKMGLYKYEWQSGTDTGPDSRTVYFDDFRVGGSDATYNTVAPGTVAPPVVNPPAPKPPAPTEPTPPANSSDIKGTDGDDKLTGTAKSEVIDGGTGVDLLDLSKLTAAAKIDLASGKADMGGGHVDTVYNMEGVIGTSASDTLLGNGAANKIRGMAGNDKIDGRGGDDILAGGDGNDDIIGGNGNDVLYGGRGTDILTGGTGSDRFVKEATGEGTDYVTDFKSNDVLDLIALNKAVKAAYGHELSADYLFFVQSGNATYVRMDVDGKGPIGMETLFHLDNVNASSLHLHDNVLLHDSDLVS